MKKIFLSILMAVSVAAGAQTTDSLSISLQQAIDLGLKNRYDVQANQYNISIAANTVSKNKREWLPAISASGNVRYNSQLQATYIPAEFIGLTQPELLAFGAKDASVFGLDLNQTIYKPGINSNIKIAQNQLALQKEVNRSDEIAVKTQIISSYLDMLLRGLQYKIAANDENRFYEYFQLATGKYKNGALIENDYLHAKLDYENAKVQAETAMQNYSLAADNLKYRINIPVQVNIVLTDTLNGENMGSYQLQTEVLTANRTEMKQLLLQQKDNQLQLIKVRQNVLPTISVFGDYSQQYLYNDFNYTQSKWWSPFSYFGVTLSIPITANIKNHNNIQEYKLKVQQTDLHIKQEDKDISYEIQKATIELSNAQHNMQATQTNYELSNTIYQNQQKQYSLGSFQYNDLLDTERSLNVAEQNYITATYNFLVARFNYEKAIGSL